MALCMDGVTDQHRQLIQELQNGEPVVLTGVVAPSGAACGKGAEQFYTLRFELVAWRINGGPMERGTLHISRIMEHQGVLDRWSKTFPALAVVEFTARLVRKSVMGRADAEVVSVIGRSEDTQLAAVAQDIRTPRSMTDPVCGTLTFDWAHDTWSGRVKWGRRMVPLSLLRESTGPGWSTQDETAALDLAKAVLADQARWNRDIKERVIKEMLDLYHHTWRAEGDPELSTSDFWSRFKLVGIGVTGGSYVTWDFNVGDKKSPLFGGAGVFVNGDLKNGVFAVDLAG